MEEWVEKHGDKRYSIFYTMSQKGSDGKQVFLRKLAYLGLELEEQVGSKTSTRPNEMEKQPSLRENENVKMKPAH